MDMDNVSVIIHNLSKGKSYNHLSHNNPVFGFVTLCIENLNCFEVIIYEICVMSFKDH